MADRDPLKNATTLDQLIIGALTVISVVLIVGAVVQDDTTYLGYLAGTASLAALYIAFLRGSLK